MNVNSNAVQKRSDESKTAAWKSARSRGVSEVLGILEPTSNEPASILAMGLWKTGTLPAPQAAS